MKEVKKVETALRTVERWEEYLLRRTAGVISITWTVIVAIAGLVTLQSNLIAGAIGMDLGTFRGFTWFIAATAGFSILIYSAVSTGMTVARSLPKEPREIIADAAHKRKSHPGLWQRFSGPAPLRQILVTVAPALALVVVILVLVASVVYFGGFLGYPVAFPLCFGIVTLLVYTLGTGRKYPEQGIAGGLLLVASPLIYALGTSGVAYMSAFAIIVIVNGVGGVYSLLAAARVLMKEKRS
jgi:hypothetical protein